MPLVVISILNWNAAAATLECLAAVSATIVPADIRIIVLDNGSTDDDWAALADGCADLGVQLIRRDTNTGFAAGHNVIIRMALEQEADYVWLLNNDAIVLPDTLHRLLNTMQTGVRLGAVSPVILARHDRAIVDFCGAVHDWQTLDSVCASSLETGRVMQHEHPNDFFLYGTALLLRCEALRQIGLLDERLFAYFEDDDLCVRLSRSGWQSQIAFDSEILHFRHSSYVDDRPPYYFYLMARNSILFYVAHAGTARRLLRVRLFARAMIKSATMQEKGYEEKANAILIGTLHGLKNIGGPPQPHVPAPAWLKVTSRFFPYRVQQWLDKISSYPAASS